MLRSKPDKVRLFARYQPKRCIEQEKIEGTLIVKLLTALLIVSIMMLSACSKKEASNSQAPTATKEPAATAKGNATTTATGGRGSMSAKIDGGSWNSVSISTATYSNGTLSFGGVDNITSPRVLAIAVRAGEAGTFRIGQSASDANANALLTIGGSVWQAVSVAGGSGTIVITSLTTTGASGTFSFTLNAVPQTSATGTKTVTDGTFNVTFATIATLPTATSAPRPAAMTAQLNGAAWGSVSMYRATFQNQFLSITGFDTNATAVFLSVAQVTGPGTFSLNLATGNGSSAIVANSSGQGWITALPGGSGSISITLLTPTRAVGTFSFEAVPSTGGASGAMRATNGQFDVTF